MSKPENESETTMRRATLIVAASIGVVAGVAGLEHGFFEMLQGSTPPASLMFASMGPPCVPAQTWDACEPAMTLVPNLLLTGVLAVLLSLLVIAWSMAFVQRQHGALGLILLSVVLLLFGGGFFPPLFGLISAAAATQINKPLPADARGSLVGLASRLWPWPLVLLVAWGLGQFVVGYFFNDLLQNTMGISLPLFVAMLPLSIYAAYARDAQGQWRGTQVAPLMSGETGHR